MDSRGSDETRDDIEEFDEETFQQEVDSHYEKIKKDINKEICKSRNNH